MTAAAERAAAQELLDAAEELTTGRWVAALAAYLRTVGYQVGDRVAVGGDPRFVIVVTIVGRVDHEAGYLVRPESGKAVFVRNHELRPIVADLLASAGHVVDSIEVVEQPADLTTCALCGRPERDELHDGPADTEGLHLFELHEPFEHGPVDEPAELETVALLAGDEVVSIGTDEQGRQKLRLRSELELPDEERTSVMREGLIFLADDVDVPACGSCDGERQVFRSGQMVPCPECIDEVSA